MSIATLFRRPRTSDQDRQLLEIAYSASTRVDREKGVIYGVKVLGGESEHGYGYTPEARAAAVPLYEGVRVYVNHKPKGMRSLEEWVGVLKESRLENGAIYADLHLRREGGRFAELCEAAETFPDAFGLSHHAFGRVVKRGGKDFVDRISRVESVDIVPRPATNRSLFESHEGAQTMKKTIAAIVAENKTDAQPWGSLFEAVDGSLELELSEGASAADQLSEAIAAATATLLEAGAGDYAKTQDALSKAFGLAKQAPPKQTNDPPPAVDKALLESVAALQQELAGLKRDQAIGRALDSHGLTRASIGAERVRLLEAAGDEAGMSALIASWPPAVRGLRAPAGETVSLLESSSVQAPKSTADVRALLRSRR